MIPRLPKYAIVTLVLLSMIVTLAYVQVRISVYNLSYQITDNLNAEREQRDRNMQLKLEIASLKAPSRIESYAVKKLRMKIDSGGKVILMSDDETEKK